MANLNCKRHTNKFQKLQEKQMQHNKQYMVQNERELSQSSFNFP